MRSHLLATVVVALAAALSLAAPALAETTTTYSLPAGINAGTGLTSDAAGNVWFTTNDQNGPNPRVGRFVPSEGVADTAAGITLWPTPTFQDAPCCATRVTSLDFDDDAGRLWLVRNDGLYGYGNASELLPGATDPFHTAVQANHVALNGVSYDAKTKRVWVAETSAGGFEPGGNRIGSRIASTDAGLALLELPNLAQQAGLAPGDFQSIRFDAKPQGVVADGKGEAWFVEADAGNPGYRLGHTNGSGYVEYLLQPCLDVSPCSGSFTGSGPTDATVGKDGSVWMTNQRNNSIWQFDPSALTFTQYLVSSFGTGFSGGRPMQIRAASDGSIWVAEFTQSNATANAIIKIVPATTSAPATATVFRTGADGPLAIEPTAGGDVYYLLNTASAPGKIGRLSGALPVEPGGGTGGQTPGGGEPAPGSGAPTPGTTTTPPSTVTPVVIKPATVGKATVSVPSNDAVRVTQICVGPPQDKCSLVYLLDSQEYVTGFPGTKESLFAIAPKKPTKPKTVELGRTEVTLSGGETKDITVSLSKKAKALLKKKKKLKVTLRVMEKQPDGTLKKVSSKPLTFKYKKPKK